MKRCENESCGKTRKWRNTGKLDEHGAVIRQCMYCGHLQAEPPPVGANLSKRIFYYDIETATMTLKVETFGLRMYSKYLNHKDIVRPTTLLCWAGVWIDNGKMGRVFGESVTPTGAKRGNDKRCAKKLRDEMNKADYIVGHNSKAFDTKKAHLRFILNGIKSPDLTVKQHDTLALAKKYFKNDSNALDYWLHSFGDTGKDHMTYDDWVECKAGNEKALKKMFKYCKHDVKRGAGVLLNFESYLAGGGITLFK